MAQVGEIPLPSVVITPAAIDDFVASYRPADQSATLVSVNSEEVDDFDQVFGDYMHEQEQEKLNHKQDTTRMKNQIATLEQAVQMLQEKLPTSSSMQTSTPRPPRSHSPVMAPSSTSNKRPWHLDDDDDEGFYEPSAKKQKGIELPLEFIVKPFLESTGKNKLIWQISHPDNVCPERSFCNYPQFPKRVHLEKCFKALDNMLYCCESQMQITNNINVLKMHSTFVFNENSYIYVHSYDSDHVVIGLCCNGCIKKNMVIERSFLQQIEFALKVNSYDHKVVQCIQHDYTFVEEPLTSGLLI